MFLVLSGMEKSWMTQWKQAWSFMDILVNKDFLLFPHLNYQSFIASAVMCNSLWVQSGLNVQMYVACIFNSIQPSHTTLIPLQYCWAALRTVKFYSGSYESSEAILLQWIPRDCAVLPWQWSSESISSSWCLLHEGKFISLHSVHSYHTFSTTQIVNCLLPTSLVNSTCKDHFAWHLFPPETPALKLSLSMYPQGKHILS